MAGRRWSKSAATDGEALVDLTAASAAKTAATTAAIRVTPIYSTAAQAGSNGPASGRRERGLRHRIGGAVRVRCGSRSAEPMGLLAFIFAMIYIATPAVVAGAVGFKSARARSIRPASGFLITCVSGIIIGTCMGVLFAVAAGGHVLVGQLLLTSYFVIAALCLLKGLSWALARGSLWLFGAARPPEEA